MAEEAKLGHAVVAILGVVCRKLIGNCNVAVGRSPGATIFDKGNTTCCVNVTRTTTTDAETL